MTLREIEHRIEQTVRGYETENGVRTRWKSPLAATAAAADPFFLELREAVGPAHALPGELLPAARSVVAFFLPFDESVARSQGRDRGASREWAAAYTETNRLIGRINEDLRSHFRELGGEAAVVPATRNFDPQRLISDWSHRHVAWIAGLGKLGLNRMLITESGCCGRIGSIITSLAIPPTPREEGEHCLFKVDGSCRKCVDRCVNEALSPDTFDRRRCYEQCLENSRRFAEPEPADICGKCLVGIPCSFRNPNRKG